MIRRVEGNRSPRCLRSALGNGAARHVVTSVQRKQRGGSKRDALSRRSLTPRLSHVVKGITGVGHVHSGGPNMTGREGHFASVVFLPQTHTPAKPDSKPFCKTRTQPLNMPRSSDAREKSEEPPRPGKPKEPGGLDVLWCPGWDPGPKERTVGRNEGLQLMTTQ